jgi:hypothetical protein
MGGATALGSIGTAGKALASSAISVTDVGGGVGAPNSPVTQQSPWKVSTTRSNLFFTLPGRYQVIYHPIPFRLRLMTFIPVYKIPPLKANEGHRAGDWGDLATPLWKGRLRFVEKGSAGAALLFEDGTTGTVIQVSNLSDF